MESFIVSFVDMMKDKIPPGLVVFLISLLPVIELRGGLIAASIIGIEWWKAFAFCFIGNMLPIPFILLFIRTILDLMKRFKPFKRLVDWIERKADKNSEKVAKYKLWGLFILVAVPLPGTGAWTGALVAAFLDLRIKRAFPVIAAGVLVAGIIVAVLSYGIAGFMA